MVPASVADEANAAQTSCLDCGACCEQGWRVDVRATDYPRMSEATRASFVEAPPSDAPAHVVGVVRKLTLTVLNEKPRCAAQTTHEGKGCSIYEERPETCRTFPKGHERCVVLRAEYGFPIGE